MAKQANEQSALQFSRSVDEKCKAVPIEREREGERVKFLLFLANFIDFQSMTMTYITLELTKTCVRHAMIEKDSENSSVN